MDDPQIASVTAIIATVQPDVLVLTDFDYDATNAALRTFSESLSVPYPYIFSAAPNSGDMTSLDLDGDGRRGDARDAMGYGRFFGDGGIAVLSRLPLGTADTGLTNLLWQDLPGATLPNIDGAPFPSQDAQAGWKLSSTAHWQVPVLIGANEFTLLISSSTPPVFDGPEDANGLRNRDELRVWTQVLDGAFGPPPALPIFVGNTNLDPFDGDGYRDAMAAFLARPDLQDPQPASAGALALADSDQRGPPALDTASWPDGPGNLRVSYVLPSTKLTVLDAGTFWPAPGTPQAALLGQGESSIGPHRLVWVDIALPANRLP